MHYRLICLVCSLLMYVNGIADEEDSQEDLILSTPEQIASLTIESSVGQLISPLSGQPALRKTDLVVKGAQNIVLRRIYIPPYMPCYFQKFKHNQAEHDKKSLYYHLRDHYKGWQFYPHLRLELNHRTMCARFSDPSGMTLDFHLSRSKKGAVSLATPPYALSNAAGEIPSGRYDPRNTQIFYQEDGNKIIVHATDGANRIYRKAASISLTTYLYLLEKEILPNGKVLKYHYHEDRQPKYVESLDPKERFVYSSLRIEGMPWKGKCHFISSSGLTVDYHYKKRPIHWEFKERLNGRHHSEKGDFICPPILTSVSSPLYRHESLDYCDRFLLEAYSGKEETFNILNGGFGQGEQHYRVHKLFLPVGQNDALEPVYEFSYQPPIPGQREGMMTVKNSDGTSVVYHFSKTLLTTLIQYFGQDQSLRKEKIFAWDENHWLKTVEVRDGQKNLFYRKGYEYDRFGNPRLETFTGDLTGNGSQETFTTKRTFSEDGKNLLLREEGEDGKVICWSYLPGTNLVTSKLIKDKEKILLREFSIYDDCNNLIQTISDDGAAEDRNNLVHVTQRTIKTYTLRQSAPFLHMPQWIEETYWEGGHIKPLAKWHLTYDQHGNVAEEEVYDAGGQLRFTICKTYNERGDVLTETNRLGQQATYTYDSRGRPETSLSFSNRIHTTFRYDTKGRLKAQIEKGDDEIIHETFSEYDFHDLKIRKRDPFGNTIHYTYDPLVNEIAKTDFPSIASLDGTATSVSTLSTYDSFGRQLTKKDANGNTTSYRYNAYGSPTEILYPNGGREHFRYAKNGQLISRTDLDGLTLNYENDILGRALSKTYMSAEGKTLAEETFTYNGFNLLTETDKEGNLKQYVYDGAGRKVREEFCDRIVEFSYDHLGWVTTISKHNGDNTLLIHYKRDLEGRVLEERKTDISGLQLYRINYSYDTDGNVETVTRYINGKQAVDTFAYDSFQRLIEKRDAEGYVTKIVYDENFTNPLGQKVLQTITIDPRGISTVETQNALTRTVKVEVLNPQGSPIACHHLNHDPQGNLLYRSDHIYENDLFRNTQTVKFTYTPDHQIESLTRAFGTKEERTTTYAYLLSGKRATKTLPDGITLAYRYHPLGFLSRIDSSDGKIRHAFDYDRLGHLQDATDETHNIAIKRQVDPFGNVLQEKFPCGVEIKKDYDAFNRPTSLKMDQQGEVLYTYDPLFLREVTRLSFQGEVLYKHAYDEYDENGNLVFESLIGDLGQIHHATDLRGQKTGISSAYFSQECHYDAVGNLMSSVIDHVEHTYSYDGLSQLSSENGPDLSCHYGYDSLYNRIQKNGKLLKVNNLNELADERECLYDLNGNQILKKSPSETYHFTYDPLNQLIEVSTEKKKVEFVYDPLGRRLSKVVYDSVGSGWKETFHEQYLYNGQNEIGAFADPTHPKNLRILGLAKHKNYPATLAIELEGRIFAPIADMQGNIRRLVDLHSRAVTSHDDFTAFGEARTKGEKIHNPWRFASKRFDPEIDLVHFGKRYYDPNFGRWITTDPAGFTDGVNLYQYVFNNPFQYIDQDGQFIQLAIPLLLWGVEIAFPALSAFAAPVIGGALMGVLAYGGYKAIQNLSEREQWSAEHQQEISDLGTYSTIHRKKKGGVDEKLPKDPFNDPNLEDISRPEAKEQGRHKFRDKRTGEVIEYDEAQPGKTGHKGHEHYHRPNPNNTGKKDYYLDSDGNPVSKGSEESHLYSPEGIWWKQ